MEAMRMSTKLTSGAMVPEFTLPRAGGGEVRIGGRRDAWQLLIVYRGRHCPLSRLYLDRLDSLADEFGRLNVEILVVTADPRDQAEADMQEFGWRFPLGYDLTVASMRSLGTYVSAPLPHETDRPFSEPGLFAVAPSGIARIIAISTSPFVLPDLDSLLNGLTFIQKRDYPPRGTLEE